MLRLAIVGAVLCLIGLAITWAVADLVPGGRARDAAALNGYIDLGGPHVDRIANAVVSLIGLGKCAAFGALLMLVALARGRPRLAAVVPVVMIGSVLSSEALKPLLPHVHQFVSGGGLHISPDSWPSGHSTAAMSMALSAVLVAPRRWRGPVAALGGIFAVAVGFSVLTLAWHLPSDVVGGFLMAGLWMSMAVIAVQVAQLRWPARSGRRAVSSAGRALWGGAAAGGSGAATIGILVLSGLALLAVLLTRAHAVLDFAESHHSLVGAAALIAALAATLVSGLTLALRR
jgi:membrane-associated phospholipid phosphatase